MRCPLTQPLCTSYGALAASSRVSLSTGAAAASIAKADTKKRVGLKVNIVGEMKIAVLNEGLCFFLLNELATRVSIYRKKIRALSR